MLYIKKTDNQKYKQKNIAFGDRVSYHLQTAATTTTHRMNSVRVRVLSASTIRLSPQCCQLSSSLSFPKAAANALELFFVPLPPAAGALAALDPPTKPHVEPPTAPIGTGT